MDDPKLLMSAQSNILYFQDSQPALQPGLPKTDHFNPGSVNVSNQHQKWVNNEKYHHEDHDISQILLCSFLMT